MNLLNKIFNKKNIVLGLAPFLLFGCKDSDAIKANLNVKQIQNSPQLELDGSGSKGENLKYKFDCGGGDKLSVSGISTKVLCEYNSWGIKNVCLTVEGEESTKFLDQIEFRSTTEKSRKCVDFDLKDKSKEDDPKTPTPPIEEIVRGGTIEGGTILNQNTVYLKDSQVISFNPSTNKIIFARGIENKLNTGNVILLPPSTKFPSGIWGKIPRNYSNKSLLISSGFLTLVPTTLEETYKEIHIDKKLIINYPKPVNILLYDKDNNPSTTNDNVFVDGNVTLSGDVNIKLNMSSSKVDDFEFRNNTGLSADAQLLIGDSLTDNYFSREVYSPTLESPPFILSGIWFNLNFVLCAGANGKLSFKMINPPGVYYDAGLETALSYESNRINKWKFTEDFTHKFELDTPTIGDTNTNLGAYISSKIGVKLNNFLGPYFKVKAGPRFNLDTNANPYWTLGFFKEGYLGAEADIFGFLNVKKEFTVFSNYTSWAQADGGIDSGNEVEDNENYIIDLRDNKKYNTKIIGNQKWMTQNLNYETEGSFCYDDNSDNCETYGRLYTWSSAKFICPEKWHIPTDIEWNLLYSSIGGDRNKVGGKMKEIGTNHWESPNEGATNKSGFNALPGGRRIRIHKGYISPTFNYLNRKAYFWSEYSSSNNPSDSLDSYVLENSSEGLSRTTWTPGFYPDNSKDIALSVRCIKDN